MKKSHPKLCNEDDTEKRLYFLHLSSLDEIPSDLSVQSKYFVTLLACDASKLEDDSIKSFASELLRLGSRYFVCWGPDCERLHDLIDEEILDSGLETSDSSCILTTWHANEELSDSIFFLICTAWTADDYIHSCHAVLGLTIADDKSCDQIQQAFANPSAFIASSTEDDN